MNIQLSPERVIIRMVEAERDNHVVDLYVESDQGGLEKLLRDIQKYTRNRQANSTSLAEYKLTPPGDEQCPSIGAVHVNPTTFVIHEAPQPSTHNQMLFYVVLGLLIVLVLAIIVALFIYLHRIMKMAERQYERQQNQPTEKVIYVDASLLGGRAQFAQRQGEGFRRQYNVPMLTLGNSGPSNQVDQSLSHKASSTESSPGLKSQDRKSKSDTHLSGKAWKVTKDENIMKDNSQIHNSKKGSPDHPQLLPSVSCPPNAVPELQKLPRDPSPDTPKSRDESLVERHSSSSSKSNPPAPRLSHSDVSGGESPETLNKGNHDAFLDESLNTSHFKLNQYLSPFFTSNCRGDEKSIHYADDNELPFEDGKFKKSFKVLSTLGKGSYGQVYLAVHKLDGNKYAIKRIELNQEELADLKKSATFREVKAMSSISNRNIVRFFTCWLESSKDDDDSNSSGEVSPSYTSSRQTKKLRSKSISILSQGKQWQHSSSLELRWESSRLDDKEQAQDEEPFGQSCSTIRSGKEKNKRKASHQQSRQVQLYIQMEYCSGMSLAHILQDTKNTLSRWDTYIIFTELLKGVSYIHKKGIIHRDLKYYFCLT